MFDSGVNEKEELKASAVFLFVCREPDDHSKSFVVPTIEFTNEED